MWITLHVITMGLAGTTKSCSLVSVNEYIVDPAKK